MKKILLDAKLNKYKANLHCHSTFSDGMLTPEEIKKLYQKNGYSIVAYTDHEIFIGHNELSDEKFLALNGYEISVIDGEYDNNKKTCHICLIQKDKDNLTQICWHRSKYLIGNSPKYKDMVKFDEAIPDYERKFTPECVSDIMTKGRENGFFVTYNHPVWSLEDYSDYMNYHGMHAMEIFNFGSFVEGYEEYNPLVYDDILRGGEHIYCTSTDDNHNWLDFDNPKNDSCGGFTVIFAENLGYDTIMDSLFKGNFYASQGPEIYSLTFDDLNIHIECSNAKKIMLSTNRRGSQSYSRTGEAVSCADFQISADEKYFRVTVVDENGNHANTNAYWLDDLYDKKA